MLFESFPTIRVEIFNILFAYLHKPFRTQSDDKVHAKIAKKQKEYGNFAQHRWRIESGYKQIKHIFY